MPGEDDAIFHRFQLHRRDVDEDVAAAQPLAIRANAGEIVLQLKEAVFRRHVQGRIGAAVHFARGIDTVVVLKGFQRARQVVIKRIGRSHAEIVEIKVTFPYEAFAQFYDDFRLRAPVQFCIGEFRPSALRHDLFVHGDRALHGLFRTARDHGGLVAVRNHSGAGCQFAGVGGNCTHGRD